MPGTFLLTPCKICEILRPKKKKPWKPRPSTATLLVEGDPIMRFFMVGTSDIGKTTIIQQMQKLAASETNFENFEMYDENWMPVNDPYAPEVRQKWKRVIHSNVAAAVATLLKQVEIFGFSWPNDTLGRYATEILEYTGDDVSEMHMKELNISAEMAEKISALWNAPNSPLRQAMRRKSEFFISDSTEYFLQSLKLHEISQPNYVPSPDDIIRARDPTTGAKDYNFRVHKTRFSIHDMGGQPIERQRLPVYLASWLQRTREGDKNFILYVAALSDYNQKHPYQQGYTLLDESIQLLKILLNMRELKNCGFILFLNKRDIFEQKLIQQNDFHQYFGQYIEEMRKAKKKSKNKESGDNVSLVDAEIVIQSCFADAFASTMRQEDTLYCRYTCAVDTQMMESIFAAVRSDLIHDLIRTGNWVPFP